jgi:hypothetical protein
MDPSSAFTNPSPFAGAFMPQPNFMQMMPPTHHESKGFWVSWGPVLCAAVITVLVLLLGYLYIFQNRSTQVGGTQEPATIHQITGADIAQQPSAPAPVYTHIPRQPQPQPQPQPQQQGNVIHSTVPLHQVVGFDP